LVMQYELETGILPSFHQVRPLARSDFRQDFGGQIQESVRKERPSAGAVMRRERVFL